MESKAPRISDLQWMRTLLLVMFRHNPAVKYEVRTKDTHRDGCVGAHISVDGWAREFRIPLAMVENHDVRRILGVFAKQSEGGILMAENSIQMIEAEGLVH